MNVRILTAITALFLWFSANTQDIHYSQFYMAPLHLNPAMAGVMNCNSRMIVNYRNQWATVLTNPYNTFSADRKSTRLNSSHVAISYAVFCLKKKKQIQQ